MEKIPFLFTSVYLAASQKCCSLSVITLPVVSLLLWFSRQHMLLSLSVYVCSFVCGLVTPAGLCLQGIRFDISVWIDLDYRCLVCLFACSLFLYKANGLALECMFIHTWQSI